MTALGLHLLGVSVWVGGLAGLLLMRVGGGLSRTALAVTTHRYSALALWGFCGVAASGVITAWARLGGFEPLTTRYGALVLLKTAALVALGVAGWWQRRRALASLDDGRPGMFARIAAAEIALMGVAMALGAALSRTQPPLNAAAVRPADAAQSLTGYPLPEPPTPREWLLGWQPDLLWLMIAALALGLYVAGVSRLRRRGDSWPLGRTIAWLAGLVLLAWVTSGGPIVYGRVLFSAHMFGHMTLSMAVPALLVLGAPVTLALRTLPTRSDDTRGPREWLVAVIASPVMRVLTFPVVAGVLFTGSLVVFYYSNLFELALTTHVGHELMHLHFLLAGYLFASVLIGIDPLPHRPSYPMRLVLLFATMIFHAFFGVALMSSTAVLVPQYFGQLERNWGADLLADQQTAGAIAWGVGELPTLAIVIMICLQWARSDEREARRLDRAADRDGDAALTAYNDMLSRMGRGDR